MKTYVVLDDYDAFEKFDGVQTLDTSIKKVNAASHKAAAEAFAAQGTFDGYDLEYGDVASIVVYDPKTLVAKRFKVAAPDVRFKITESKERA